MAFSGSSFLCLFSLFLLLSSAIALVPKSPYSSSLINPRKISHSHHHHHHHHHHHSSLINKPYKTKYFTQILDHFNYYPKSYDTFQQRYLINDTHWGGANKKAPIFVYTGNEGDIEWFAQNTGFLFDNAPHFNALLVFIEVIIEFLFLLLIRFLLINPFC